MAPREEEWALSARDRQGEGSCCGLVWGRGSMKWSGCCWWVWDHVNLGLNIEDQASSSSGWNSTGIEVGDDHDEPLPPYVRYSGVGRGAGL
jgi:hypothetical protein